MVGSMRPITFLGYFLSLFILEKGFFGTTLNLLSELMDEINYNNIIGKIFQA